MKIKPITLEIEDDDWKEFKRNLSRPTTLNDGVVDLIKKHNKKMR